MASESSVNGPEIENLESGSDIDFVSDEEEENQYEIDNCTSEALLERDTYSFRCLRKVLMSDSSLLRHPLYHFPPLIDPGVDEAFNYIEPEPIYSLIGADKYKDLCKEFNIVPFSRIIHCLDTETLNLKFYCLSEQQIRAVSNALTANNCVKCVNLEENHLEEKSVEYLSNMLEENSTIEVLNMKKCRIGFIGVKKLNEALSVNNKIQELDLSFNEIGDEGLNFLQSALIRNQSIKTINLSHNDLTEKSADVLYEILKNNTSIENIDLSWNRFSTGPGNKKLFLGFMVHPYICKLNLAWNGIGTTISMLPIMKYIIDSTTLQYLDLSNNRIGGPSLNMTKRALMKNDSLIEVKIGYNIFKPDEAYFLANTLIEKPKVSSLQLIDMENMCVNKNFLNLANNIKKRDKKVVFGYVLHNFIIHGPDINKLLFERCRYILQKPKKKKQKKDFGHFVLSLPDTLIPVTDFPLLLKKQKIKKLDKDLQTELLKRFTDRKKAFDCPLMKETYMKYYPDTVLPPKIDKRKKKGKKDKKKAKVDMEKENLKEETTEKPLLNENVPASEEINPEKDVENVQIVETVVAVENEDSSHQQDPQQMNIEEKQ